jgi:hypothetical protein
MLAALPACLFDTRTAEPPDAGGSTVSLNDPLQVFVAIKQSLTSQQDANYERALSSQFIFSPTLQDSLDQNFINTGVYSDWNKTREMDFLGLLLADAQHLRADFSPSVLVNKNTYVRYKVNYSLVVVNTATPTDTTRYVGVAQFDVENEGGNWRLTFWNDIETVDGFSTWGYLRGILGLQLGP